jgi:hypothetical protein
LRPGFRNVLLEDALRLVLVYLAAGDRRYERSAVRFHARFLCGDPDGKGAEKVTARVDWC